MIRTIITPDSEQITLPIPEKYVGIELEIMIVPIKDASPESVYPPKTPVFGAAKGKFKTSDDFDVPKATSAIEEEDGLALILSGAWNTFFRELEAIEGEDIPDNFVEQFRMSNFRTPEELTLL
jgi:hypothetical protein